MQPDWDVVIVGGGIHGVGVAQAAAAAGHRVLLLERAGLASGTSSRSSKLIHGGLRYLEQGRLSLVRECLRERAILLRIAPGLVRLRDFILPIYDRTRRRPWKVRAGLSLYAALSGLRRASLFSTVPRTQWGDLDGLETGGLQKVFRYHDGQTDDARLTAAVMASAQSLGAELAVPATFRAAHVDGDGCRIEYERDGCAITCRSSTLVNAAGPWAARVQASVTPGPPPRAVDLIQGTHIVLRGEVEQGAYYVESPADGRAVFVMPWHAGTTLVGTTETPFDGDPATVAPSAAEERYLAEIVDRHFPRYGATQPGAIVRSFAGLRVLPAASGAAFARTRETVLDADDSSRPRVVAMYGGKLTAYRSTAAKVMRRLAAVLPPRARVADTATLRLPSPSGNEGA